MSTQDEGDRLLGCHATPCMSLKAAPPPRESGTARPLDLLCPGRGGRAKHLRAWTRVGCGGADHPGTVVVQPFRSRPATGRALIGWPGPPLQGSTDRRRSPSPVPLPRSRCMAPTRPHHLQTPWASVSQQHTRCFPSLSPWPSIRWTSPWRASRAAPRRCRASRSATCWS